MNIKYLWQLAEDMKIVLFICAGVKKWNKVCKGKGYFL